MKTQQIFLKSKQKNPLKRLMRLVELKVMSEKPLCEDGRVCEHKNIGFILINCLNPKDNKIELKAFCYECYKAAEKEKNSVLLELYGKINKVE